MKKLLSSLMALALISTPIITTISCGKDKTKDDGKKDNSSDDSYSKLTDNLKNTYDSLEFMSRVILTSRHENLNINLNETLSSLLTPKMTAEFFPKTFQHDGKTVSFAKVSNYAQNLAPIFNKMDQDGYGGSYASYIMKMYNDKFYTNPDGKDGFLDTFNQDATDNKINGGKAQGYYAGYSKDMTLDPTTADMSWGIQDTGPLTNYLLNKGYMGDSAQSTSASGGPATKTPAYTNGSGWLYYNTIIANKGASGSDISKKLRNDDYWKNKGITLDKIGDVNKKNQSGEIGATITDDFFTKAQKFDTAGAKLFNTIGSVNVISNGTELTSLFSSINNSEDGLKNLVSTLDYLFPIFKGNIGNIFAPNARMITTKLSYWFLDALETTLVKQEEFEGITKDLKNDYKSGLAGIVHPTMEEYFAADNKKSGVKGLQELFSVVSQVLSDAKNKEIFLNSLKETDKTKNSIFNNINGEAKGYIKESIANAFANEDKWNQFWTGLSGILKFFITAYEKGNDSEISKTIQKLDPQNKNSFTSLDPTTKVQFMNEVLGYNNGKPSKDSLIEKLYNGFSDMSGIEKKSQDNAISILLNSLTNQVNSQMQEPFENILQYITEDDYWTKSKIHFTKNNSKDSGNTLEFEINYTGNGDSTSMASKVTKNDGVTSKELAKNNFNPYQTEKPDIKNDALDSDRKTGVMGLKNLDDSFGKTPEEKLKNYDGLGNIEDYKKVNFKYNVQWKNIGTSERPYWIMTKCDATNDKGQRFYNIY
ncbi:hypothetical protein [Spiroplasma endosymbiont of Crioceris asparagi]|uniref:hypothetical protein n=1 Tax=Spiroplasma endosymbiont of Crioceris asparagi TaxID=3066286 RepID=UPI0030CD64CC